MHSLDNSAAARQSTAADSMVSNTSAAEPEQSRHLVRLLTSAVAGSWTRFNPAQRLQRLDVYLRARGSADARIFLDPQGLYRLRRAGYSDPSELKERTLLAAFCCFLLRSRGRGCGSAVAGWG